MYPALYVFIRTHMGWLRLVGSFKLQVSFAKEPYKRDHILQQRPTILRSLLIEATPYPALWKCLCFCLSQDISSRIISLYINTHTYVSYVPIYIYLLKYIHVCPCICTCISTCICM